MNIYIRTARLITLVMVASTLLTVAPTWAKNNKDGFAFDLVRSPALASSPDCVANASGRAQIQEAGPVQILNVEVQGLPPNTDFDFFVIQVPNGPFGMAWYQGDIETNRKGFGHGTFIGRFSIETFVVAPGSTDAPLTFDKNFPSVSPNPETGPIQMYHLVDCNG